MKISLKNIYNLTAKNSWQFFPESFNLKIKETWPTDTVHNIKFKEKKSMSVNSHQ